MKHLSFIVFEQWPIQYFQAIISCPKAKKVKITLQYTGSMNRLTYTASENTPLGKEWVRGKNDKGYSFLQDLVQS